ncbi:MAG: hypothetical protein A2W26_02475 [Acidobacteria bacterium RBG_16_64_8]|nr:MAG: hypothetical protein A2W26_02475 [Acidobacteria bacterium RBG_16_64_8]
MDVSKILKSFFKRGAVVPEVTQFSLDAQVMTERLLWLMLASQNPVPAGRFERALTGDVIGNVAGYYELYQNKGLNPVAVAIYATFTGVAGKQVKLATKNDPSDVTVVDYLGNTAAPPSFNKRISATTVLRPGEILYAGTADTAFALVVGDVFNVRIFDPREYVADSVWQAR